MDREDQPRLGSDKSSSAEPRANVLKLIPERHRFLALVLLVTESALGTGVAVIPDAHNLWGLSVLAGSLLVFLSVGTYIEIRNMDAETWLQPYAETFAREIIDVLDGYLANLPPGEKMEAWTSLRDGLIDYENPKAPRAYLQFRADAAKTVEKIKLPPKPTKRSQSPSVQPSSGE